MDPLWRTSDLHARPRPCTHCGYIGKHVSIPSLRCALFERDVARAARVTAERALRRTDEVFQATVNLRRASAKEVHQQDEAIEALARALQEAKNRRRAMNETLLAHRELEDVLLKQHNATVDVVRAAEEAEDEAANVVFRVVERDNVNMENWAAAEHDVDKETEWWEESEVGSLDEEQERRYDQWRDLHETRWAREREDLRREVEERRCAREEKREAEEVEESREHQMSRVEEWAESLQTSAPEAPVIKKEEDMEEEEGAGDLWKAVPMARTPGEASCTQSAPVTITSGSPECRDPRRLLFSQDCDSSGTLPRVIQPTRFQPKLMRKKRRSQRREPYPPVCT